MELEKLRHGTELIKRGFASMQKGGVIMDVTNPEQAKIAEDAGAVAVMALQAVPADIRKAGGVARMADPQIITEIIECVTIPVMAKARIGHFVEAEILQALGVDMVDESEVLTPADEKFHIDKTQFTVPFVCGARNLGEALRRVNEGAAMIRTKGEAGTGDVREAVRHMKQITGEIRALAGKTKEELMFTAREIEAPIELVIETAQLQRLPVVNFAAGGVATPADAALMMRLGADGVFVGSGIFKAEKPELMASAIVEAVNNYDNPEKLAEISKGIGAGMKGISTDTIPPEQALQTRGW
ncbi:pyridoxal 5'-phosphate synthase lyase subunit PdxS [uncultured Methanomethylovorans sp.]|uniref:pyridoxal 5'-phosphate synthase lyase subunit PdxS n=1 Tax=uncultured Methanomethylovorans sp. TaxID=183759 RepID=UPI002AA6A1E4|nr:pyridoxal 5'-phosphate synthase lyase subunit PdxS [uncultured Methanomethylovorans sp.]